MIRHAKAETFPRGSLSAKVDRQKYIKITSIASNSQQLAKDVYMKLIFTRVRNKNIKSLIMKQFTK